MATTAEKIAKIEEAQEKLQEVIDLVSEVVNEMGSTQYYEVYLLTPLKIMVSSEHGFLSRHVGLDDIINSLREQDDDEETPEAEPPDMTWSDALGWVTIPENEAH